MAWYRVGGGGLPNSIKTGMNNVLNKKFSTATTYPPNEWATEVNLLGALEEKTASGSVVTFSDGADDVPLKSCEVTLPASLDGYSSADVVQTGLQLLPVTIPTNGNGITYTDNGDGTFNANGQASATITNRYVFTSSDMNTLKRGETYYISGCPSGGASNIYKLQVWNASTSSQVAVDYGSGASFIMPQDGTIYVRFVIYSGQEVDFTVKPMITKEQTTEHEQYHATTHTASLGRTIHGGSVDVVKGEGTEPYQEIDLGDLTWVYASASNRFYANINLAGIYTNFPTNASEVADITCADYETISFSSLSGDTSLNNKVAGVTTDAPFITIRDTRYSNANDFKNAVTGKKAVIPLVTPTYFTFSPVEINSRLGDNTMWSDGDMSVVYRSSGTMTPILPTLISKNITANNTYMASDDGVDGYDEVVVNVPSQEPTVTPLNSPNAFMTTSGISGTDVVRTVRTETAPSDGKYVFASDSTCKTNTGSGDGFIDIQKNGVSVVKQYMSANTTTDITIPEIEVVTGDTVDFIVGFDNAHTSCNFQLYTGIAFVEEVSP